MASDTIGRRTSGLLSPPQNQGSCGSCWAFASTHAYTDHLSIQAGRRHDQISSQHLTACLRNRLVVNGCCGGYLLSGFQFFQYTGAVTDSCAPYTLAGFERRFKSPIQDFCPASCNDGTPFQPADLRLHGFRELQENEVITALRTGPVIAGMSTSDRFKYDYRCGVFCFDPYTDKFTGGHAVEIVDYGTTSSGINFWVVKNSWGSRWGEDGYFRIRRGDLIFAFATPVLSVLSTSLNMSSSTMDVMNITMSLPILNVMTCAPNVVSDPGDDTLVMSAVDVALMQLNGHIPCRDNSPATNISLVSVTNATAQVIEGSVLTFNIVVNVQGCMRPTQANVDAEVIAYLNGTFELTDHTFQYLGESGATAIPSNIYLFLVTTILTVVLTFSCY